MQSPSSVEEIFQLHESVLALTKAYVESLSSSETKLKEHVDVLNSVIQSVGAGLVVVSPDLRILLINQSLAAIVGWKSIDKASRSLDEFYAAGYKGFLADGVTPLEKGQELIVQSMNRRERMEAELLLRGPDLPEEGIWLRASAAPIINDQGELLGSVAIYHDITELKTAYMSVSELYNTAPCGYLSLDAQGTILEMNNTLLKLIGCKREEVQQKINFGSLLLPKSLDTFLQYLPQLPRLEPLSNVQLELQSISGNTLVVLWSAKPVKSKQGKFLHSSCTIYDITHSKTLEIQRDALAAIITHDIKNHLIAGGQLLDTIFMDVPDRLDEEDRALVTSMLVANDQYLNLSTDLLHLYRGGYGQFEPSFETLSMRDVIEDVVKLNSASARMMNVILELDAYPAVEDTVTADVQTLSRVFHNLIHNALRFSPAQGKVRISIRNKDDQIVVGVTDQGPGMTPEVVESLFQPFWTGKIEFSQYTSTRLGLYLCRSILEAHHGQITVRSKLGSGTTFNVSLPAAAGLDSVSPANT